VSRHIDATYLFPLKDAPDDDALRTRLLKVYLSLNQADAAITMASTYLLDERGDKATTYNHMGNAYVMKGDLVQAALQYKQAAALRPDDPGIQRNLEQAMQALGRAQPTASSQVATTESGVKAAALDVGVDSFYWIE